MKTALAFADDEDPRPAEHITPPRPGSPDAPNPRPTIALPSPNSDPSGGPQSTGRHAPIATRGTGAAGLTSPAAVPPAIPDEVSPQGTKSLRQSRSHAAPTGTPTGGDQTTGGQLRDDSQADDAAGLDVPDQAALIHTTPTKASLLDPALSLAADILDDLERVRIANENRLRQLTRTGEDADGEERGFGLDESHPDVARLAAMVETLAKVEHDATLNLQRKLRKHPLGPWAKAQRGIGEKQGARLLAAIGDPYIRPESINEDGSIRWKEGPRTVSALWAYCGLHVLPAGQSTTEAHVAHAGGDQLGGDLGPDSADTQSTRAGVAAKRRKGVRSNWSGNAKMRSYLVAESCMKQLDAACRDGQTGHVARVGAAVPAQDDAGQGGQTASDSRRTVAAPVCACSPYRVVYDTRRAHTAVSHPEWTDGHSHNDALRIAAKTILRDLWRAARDHHHNDDGATP